MDILLGACIGVLVAVSATALWRLVSGQRAVLSPEAGAREAALHAATATLPHLRRGLDRETAAWAIRHLRALTGAEAVALTDTDSILAVDGIDAGRLRPGTNVAWLVAGDADRISVRSLPSGHAPGPGPWHAVVAPLLVQAQRVGSLIAFATSPGGVTPEDTRAAGEAASLVAAQIELSTVASQGERLVEAELRALRAQI